MKARGRGCGVLCLALSLLFAGGTRPLQAQGQLALTTVQAMNYGTLLPGTPDAVSVTDPVRRGELELKAKGDVEILVLLPPFMVSLSGAEIPLEFGFGDGGLQLRGDAGVTFFDPTTSYRFTMAPNQSPARIFLGGLARPAADQAAGDYTAEIVVLVATP